jgi:hypothetical protein
MSLLSDHAFSAFGKEYKLFRVNYTGAAVAFSVDQSASSVAVVESGSSAPAVSLGASDSNFEKTVTLAAGGTASIVIVIAAHGGGTIASTKN